MKLRLFQIDAFTDQVFQGNPASVCPLEHWLPAELMQQIAMENNQAETAFYTQADGHFEIRWFTPTVEVDLCGHATLAAAFVLFQFENFPDSTVQFRSRSGVLSVRNDMDVLTLDFPVDIPFRVVNPDGLVGAIGLEPDAIFRCKTDYMLVYSDAEEILSLKPDMRLLAEANARGICATAPGQDVDFVSRFFAPQCGIPEDPVTGSAHAFLTPYWVDRLKRNELSARQLSKRGGFLRCRLTGERVEISGKARAYMTGEIDLDISN